MPPLAAVDCRHYAERVELVQPVSVSQGVLFDATS